MEDRLTPADYFVNTSNDPNPPPGPPPFGETEWLTLREAIFRANQLNEASTITFRSYLGAGVITIDGDAGAFDAISKDITIIGNTSLLAVTQIQRSFDPNAPSFRIFNVTNNATFNLSTIALFNGSDTTGGAIRVNSGSTANLYNVTATGHKATGNGGGIFNAGTLTVENSVISSNNSSASGGGIYNSGTAYIQFSTTIQNNHADVNGGGINNTSSGTLYINGAMIQQNDADFDGGGISNAASGTVTIEDTTIRTNQAGTSGVGDGGGIANRGQLTIIDSWIRSNWGIATGGGGIACLGGTATLTNVFINDNRARNAGGTGTGGGFTIAAGARLELYECEVAGNLADVVATTGGDILAGGQFQEFDCNILDNIRQN